MDYTTIMEYIMTIRVQENNFSSIKYLTQTQFVRYMYTGKMILNIPEDEEIITKFRSGELHITLNICQQ